MKSIRVAIVSALFLITAGASVAQRSQKDIEGSWSGKLRESGVDLRLVFNFVMEADTVKATLDSPDQGAMGIPLGRVTFENDTLVVNAPMLKGQYRGVFNGDSILSGTWSQLGKEYALNLKKDGEPVTYNRPQEPKPPYPYLEQEITFRNNIENFDLSGTLTLPEGPGPFPAVVLISGSGAQDRDETIFNHKPFKVIADHLTRNGIAVLRYDDRGTGRSKGSMIKATSLTLADDAEAAVNYLLERTDIDHTRIGLTGHSEGGLIAPIVASRNENIAFIVSLAGPGVNGYTVILKQNRDLSSLSGVSESQINENIRVLGKICEFVIAEEDQRKVAKEAMEWYSKDLADKALDPEERRNRMTSFTQSLISVNNPWFRYFLATDPAIFWSKVICPVLALNGEKDMQVNAEQNLPAIREALKKSGNRKVKTTLLPSHNHLFQHCTTGSPSEYITIEETFSPEALALMTDWIRKTLKMK
jgi:dienelactone hydrolase